MGKGHQVEKPQQQALLASRRLAKRQAPQRHPWRSAPLRNYLQPPPHYRIRQHATPPNPAHLQVFLREPRLREAQEQQQPAVVLRRSEHLVAKRSLQDPPASAEPPGQAPQTCPERL